MTLASLVGGTCMRGGQPLSGFNYFKWVKEVSTPPCGVCRGGRVDPAHPGEQRSGSLCNQIGREAARAAHRGWDVGFVLALFVREVMTCLKVGSDGRLHLDAFRWQHINSVWMEGEKNQEQRKLNFSTSLCHSAWLIRMFPTLLSDLGC